MMLIREYEEGEFAVCVCHRRSSSDKDKFYETERRSLEEALLIRLLLHDG